MYKNILYFNLKKYMIYEILYTKDVYIKTIIYFIFLNGIKRYLLKTILSISVDINDMIKYQWFL